MRENIEIEKEVKKVVSENSFGASILNYI